MSHHSKKILNSQLELFGESCLHLQTYITAFEKQIKNATKECLNNTSGTSMSVKDAIVMVTTAQHTILEHIDMLTVSNTLYRPHEETEENTQQKQQQQQQQQQQTEAERASNDQIVDVLDSKISKRLDHIETSLTALQDSKQKTDCELSEIKQWKDNSQTERNDIEIKIELSSKEHKQNFEDLRKQTSEQDSTLEELKNEIKILKQREFKSNTTLEKLIQDVKESENSLLKIEYDLHVKKETSDNLTQEIKSWSDKISVLQKNKNYMTNKIEGLFFKHSVTCRMIQQRLAPLDKLFQMFNQNFGTSEEKISKVKKLEKDLLKLSQDFYSMANQPVKHSTLGFTAFDGYTDELFDAIPYLRVERNLGNHFNHNTGEFTAPVDGLYIASLTIEQAGDQAVAASALLISGDVGSCPVHVVTKDKSVHETGTFVVWMKTGDQLYSWTNCKTCNLIRFSCFLLGV